MSVFETKQGELYELKAELQSDRRERKKEALKKIIASMTVGKDVSQLFPDVMRCMQTDNVELKKLVYLYVMNYAKSQPDMAILTTSTFIRDCHDPNPLIRALAIRTMGSIRVDKIIEHLCDPLRKCLKDEDPYVRKTAAVCVAKLYETNQQLVDDQGFLDLLRDLLADSNGMVVANTVAALSEIAEKSPHLNIFDLNGPLINKLITAMNECTEWGQIFILDAIANYSTQDEKEMQSICERLTPRLAHANSAVVLSTVKVLIKFIQLMNPKSDVVNQLYRKLAPPLVTLLSAEPETQYVALRNINLIVQKRSDILRKEIKVFFVKYNDPVYVKLEKLDIMIRLTTDENIVPVLSELKEYATEVDVDFVRKAVRAIGRCAIKVEEAAERCVSTLIDLIQTKVNYVVQEAIVVIKDIFRKYPNKYESIIAVLCENLETLDEPDARAAMIWIIGEYAERIDNADELLEGFLDSFKDESSHVQCQLLTAIVKLFLKKPLNGPQSLVTRVLGLVTQETDNPDLRDRGYIYWRLLSTDPKAAKEVVLADKPLISEETDLLEPTLLDELLGHIGSLASVYHRPAHTFVDGRFRMWKTTSRNTQGDRTEPSPSVEMVAQPVVISNQVDLLSGDFDILGPLPTTGPTTLDLLDTNPSNIPNLLDDDLSSILGIESSTTTTTATTATAAAPTTTMTNSPSIAETSLEEIFGSLTMTNTSNPFLSSSQSLALPKDIWLTAVKGKGLEVRGTFVRRQNRIVMEMEFTNKTLQPLHDFALQINHNSFGLTPAQPLSVPSPIFPNQSVPVQLPLNTNGSIMKMDPLTNLQVAIKDNIDVLYFTCLVPMHVYFTEENPLDKRIFIQAWNEIPEQNEVRSSLINTRNFTVDQIQQQCQVNNIQTVNRTVIEQKEMLFQTMKLTNGILILAELTFTPGVATISLSLKTKIPDVAQPTIRAYEAILTATA